MTLCENVAVSVVTCPNPYQRKFFSRCKRMRSSRPRTAIPHLVSGAARNELSRAILAADSRCPAPPMSAFAISAFSGVYHQRAKDQGAAYYQAIGIE